MPPVAATMPPKKRPAAASASREVEELRRKAAKLEKENAKLRGETPKKKAPVGPTGEAYPGLQLIDININTNR